MSVAEVLHAIWLAYWEIFGLNLVFFVWGVAFLVVPVLFIGAVVIDLAHRAWFYATTTPEERAEKADTSRSMREWRERLWLESKYSHLDPWERRAMEREYQRKRESDGMTEAAKKSGLARWCMKWNQRAKERWQRRLESDGMTE